MNAANSYGTKDWFEQMFSSARDGYDEWGHQWRASQKYRYILALSTIEELLSQGNPQSILDLGCGLGDFTNMVRSVNPKNILRGMDISRNAVWGARRKYPQIKFRYGELPDISYVEKFDGIIALECVNYLDEKKRKTALNNIHIHLKPGGWFLFSSPIDDGSRYFSIDQARQLFRQIGFRIHEIHYNYARLYTRFERPFLKILHISRILKEMEIDPDKKWSGKKEVLHRITLLPVMGYILKKTIKVLAHVSCKMLRPIAFVRLFQWASRTFLGNRGRSHIVIMAFKDE